MSTFHLLAMFANQYKINPNEIGVPTTITTPGQGLAKVVALLMQIIGLLSVVMIIVGGLLMVLASGNPARFKQGREAVIYAIVGIAIAISGYAIVTYISGSIGA
jgi:hypothetical protein